MPRRSAVLFSAVALSLALPAAAHAADPPPGAAAAPDDLDCAVHVMTALSSGIDLLDSPGLDPKQRQETEQAVSRLEAALSYFVARLEDKSKAPGFRGAINARYAASRVADVKTKAARTKQCLDREKKAQLDFLSRVKSS